METSGAAAGRQITRVPPTDTGSAAGHNVLRPLG